MGAEEIASGSLSSLEVVCRRHSLYEWSRGAESAWCLKTSGWGSACFPGCVCEMRW
jgi:hypothetical protein